MDEAEYWTRLEYRICRELAGMRAGGLRDWWCDGFVPETLDEGRGVFSGRVWMGRGGRDQEVWDFTLMLGAVPGAGERIDWASLLPGEDVTGWLSMDFNQKAMKIEPGGARTDRNG